MAPTDEVFRRLDAACHGQRRSSGDAGAEKRPPALPGTTRGSSRPPAAAWPEEEASTQSGADESGHSADDVAFEEWVGTWRRLCAEASELEAECRDEALRPRRMSSTQLADVASELAQLDADRARWHEGMWGNAGRLRKRVHSLAQNARGCSRPGQLQVVARATQRDMESFKAQQRSEYEADAGQEAALQEALAALARRCDRWAAEPSALQEEAPRPSTAPPGGGEEEARLRGREGSAGGAGSASSASPRRQSSSRGARGPPGSEEGLQLAVAPSAPSAGSRSRSGSRAATAAYKDPEIAEIKESIQALEQEGKDAGGETGGWPSLQHAIFMRIFRMFNMKASQQCFARVRERLPDLTEEDLAGHVRWLDECGERQAQKKKLLARWRERRVELQREAADLEEEQHAEEAELRREEEERRERQRAEKRTKVMEWRAAREAEEHRAASLHRGAELEQEQRERELKRRREEQVKREAEAYKTQREGQERLQAARASAAAAARRSVSQEDRQRIALRNLELLRKKLQAQPGQVHCRSGSVPQMPPRIRSFGHVESRVCDDAANSARGGGARPPKAAARPSSARARSASNGPPARGSDQRPPAPA